MNSTILGIGFLAFCVAAAFAQNTADPRQLLAGKWTCTTGTIDGSPLAAETAKILTLTLTGDRFKTQRGDQVLFDSTYTIDASKEPNQIDMISTEGELKGKPGLGIYKLDGEKLTLCYTLPGKERPTKFESPPKSGIYLIEWQRARP